MQEEEDGNLFDVEEHHSLWNAVRKQLRMASEISAAQPTVYKKEYAARLTFFGIFARKQDIAQDQGQAQMVRMRRCLL